MAEAIVGALTPYGYVYCVTNAVNGKRYVGMTRHSIEKRWIAHLKAARQSRGSALHAAIRKHGSENFSIELISMACDRPSLCREEQRYIEAFGTFTPAGYNLTEGGDGSHGISPSAETRLKRSRSVKASWASEASKSARARAQKEAWARDPQRKERAKDLLLGGVGVKMRRKAPSFSDPEIQKKVNIARAKYWQTPESRSKQAEVTRKVWEGADRAKWAEASSVKQRTPEGRAAAAERSRANWASPEYREKMSAAHRAARERRRLASSNA